MTDYRTPIDPRGRQLVSVEGRPVGTIVDAQPPDDDNRQVVAVQFGPNEPLRLAVLDVVHTDDPHVQVRWTADHIQQSPVLPHPQAGPNALQTAIDAARRHYSLEGFGLSGFVADDASTATTVDDGFDPDRSLVAPAPAADDNDDPPWLITAAHFADDDENWDESPDPRPGN